VTADLLVGVLLVATAVTGTAVALTRDPTRQALVLSAYGLVLGVLMVALQAPDVALAQIGIGTAVVPLLVILTVAKVDRELADREGADDTSDDADDRADDRAGERDR
jgi:energy-converting hydrogenase B subunit D